MPATRGPTNGSRRRALSVLSVLPVTIYGVLLIPTLDVRAAPEPVTPSLQTVELGRSTLTKIDPVAHLGNVASDRTTPQLRPQDEDTAVFASETLETDPFRLVALTWSGDQLPASTQILVRMRSAGDWSPWTELHDDGHGPDSDDAEATLSRRGTEPVFAKASDAVEVRIETPARSLPADVRIDLVDPGDSPADSAVGINSASSAQAADLTKPTIYTRADWGADENLREPGNPDYGAIHGMFVHHTAGTNSYARSDVPAIIRSIYAYHVNGRGWRDIGYNFLIDHFGRIWEGRFGGMTKAVVGAHTANYNGNSFGASVLGTYTTHAPESAMLSAYQRLIAWKFAIHGVKPTVKFAYPGQRTLPTISGHRDTKATECPGARLYARLGTIRLGVQSILNRTAVTSTLDLRSATDSTRPGARIYFTPVWRTASGVGIDGTVSLQRRTNGSWSHVKRVTVRNGYGIVSVVPVANTTYRLRSNPATSPLNVPRVGSSWKRITVGSNAATVLLVGPSTVTRGHSAELHITWLWRGEDVDGKINLQRMTADGLRWTHLRQVTVTNGAATTTITPSSTHIYRLRASSARSPAGVSTAHPSGTSNERRVVVQE